MSTFGIDLGTTATLVARGYQGRGPESVETEVLELEQPGYEDRSLSYLPSVAFIPGEEDASLPLSFDGEPIVGLWAKEEGHHKDPARCVRAVKRLMGHQIFLEKAGGKTPSQISALYLQELLRQVLEEKGYKLDELTVTVPASYTTNQRSDTLQAIDIAFDKLEQPRLKKQQRARILISEPVAALLAFISEDVQKADPQVDVARSPTVLVYDIGGGTLDLTVVELSWQDPRGASSLDNLRFEVRAISRYNQFGGEDFDRRLARKYLLPRLLEREDTELSEEERMALRYDLINEAERLKIELNTAMDLFGENQAHLTVNPSVRGRECPFSVELSRGEYEEMMKPFLEERDEAKLEEGTKNAFLPVSQLLQQHGWSKDDVDYLLPVGGMANLIPLQEALKRYWRREESLLRYPWPAQAVARGAAVYSYLKAADRGFDIDEPAADAYYVRTKEGFDILLRQRQQRGERREYHVDRDKILLQLFAGADPPEHGGLESIYHTLIYQGGTIVQLDEPCEKGEPVFIELERRYATKVPVVCVFVGDESNLVEKIDFDKLNSTQERR